MTKFVCPFPFSRLELGAVHNEFIPCCYSWLKKEYHDIPNEVKKDSNRYNQIWNSRQAIELRNSILNGSYKYCKLDRCNKPERNISQQYQKHDQESMNDETPIGEQNHRAILEDQPILPEGPSSISLSADLKCNLKCPTCRNNFITKNNQEREKLIKSEIDFIYSHKDSLVTIKLSNGGEVLYSKDQRELLKSFNSYDFPKLDHVYIISNGLLLNQKALDDLFPGSSYIKKITISIDAGDEKTYLKTRGGDWNKLLKNIKWLGRKRKNNDFFSLSMNFVLRKENYQSLPDLIKLARKNYFDYIEIVEFDNWNELFNMDLQIGKDYESEAVHQIQHPEHSKLIAILSKFKDDDDIRINLHGLAL